MRKMIRAGLDNSRSGAASVEVTGASFMEVIAGGLRAMSNEFKGVAGHSAEYFGDTRDHWWNSDFLKLVAARWRLSTVRDVLDVGCGVGHWGLVLASVLPDAARVTGVDREAAWIEHATLRAAARGLADRFFYLQGEAEHLPFPDDSFDVTTCQTVLIHVPNPDAVIAEMRRVTRPGGLVAVAEPNNLTSETCGSGARPKRAAIFWRAAERSGISPGTSRGHSPLDGGRSAAWMTGRIMAQEAERSTW